MLWQDWPFLFLLLPLPLLQFSSLPCSVFSSYPFVHHFLISELSISLCQVPIVSTSCLLSLFFLVFSDAHCDFSIPSHFPFHFFSLPHLRLPCTSEASVCFASFPIFTTALPTVLSRGVVLHNFSYISASLLILGCCFGSTTLFGFTSTRL